MSASTAIMFMCLLLIQLCTLALAAPVGRVRPEFRNLRRSMSNTWPESVPPDMVPWVDERNALKGMNLPISARMAGSGRPYKLSRTVENFEL
jgi:hypothetical protein